MNYNMCIAMDCIGILLLVLILTDFGSSGSRSHDFASRMFYTMIGVNIGLLTSDMITWFVIGVNTPFAREVHKLSLFIYYMLHSPMCFFWVLYCDYKLHEDTARIRRRAPMLLTPVIIMSALLVMNLYRPVVYQVTPENDYLRMPLYPLSVLLCMPHYLYSLVITLKEMRRPDRKRFSRGPARFLLLYPVFPLLFVLIQSLTYGMAIIWMGSVISLLILYFNLQNAKITTDALTGINNRHRFESYFRYKLRNRSSDSYLFLLMIDINDFKTINDKHGHLAGDIAIRTTARCILEGVRRTDFVARIGGDEFVVIGECPARTLVDDVILSIHRALRHAPSDQPVSVSIGCSVLAPDDVRSADDLILEADRNMYHQKRADGVR